MFTKLLLCWGCLFHKVKLSAFQISEKDGRELERLQTAFYQIVTQKFNINFFKKHHGGSLYDKAIFNVKSVRADSINFHKMMSHRN